MFSKTKSIFNNNDDFGVQEYREDVSVLFELNAVTVELINPSQQKMDTLQGDFMGVKTNTYKDNKTLIKINVNSNNAESDTLGMEGYSGGGSVRYTCYTTHDTVISDKSLIKFIDGYRYNIRKGEVYRVIMKDTGVWNGQYGYKNFEIVKVEDLGAKNW